MLTIDYPIMLYDTLKKEKILFKTLIPEKVGIYMCGITVYDSCHIGHARAQIALDVIIRYLIYRGYSVYFIRNITDIDDKIIKKSIDKQQNPNDLVDDMITSMNQDFARLNLIQPQYEPRVTHFISEIIEIINILIEKGYAYLMNRDVYFNVASYKDYGQLSKQSLAALQIGSRIDPIYPKSDMHDFVLWKKSKEGEPSWESPWGPGRPGWHIECSALAHHFLGSVFDIHVGGMDLCFPHHENEIAQSDAAYGSIPANYWVHIGLVTVAGEKMSKSLKNYFYIKDILDSYSHNVLRLAFLKSHYRSPISFSIELLEEAKSTLENLYTYIESDILTTPTREPIQELSSTKMYIHQFHLALSNDFNVPQALAILFDIVKKIKNSNEVEKQQLSMLLGQYFLLLGFDIQEISAYKSRSEPIINTKVIDALLAERDEARKKADYQKADIIRNILLRYGIILEDTPSGTIWKLSNKPS